jgi:hypothetical protein
MFAFCCSKNQSGRTPVRPLGENPCDALNEAHVFDFGELPLFFDFFFAFAITLLLSFDELDLVGTKAPSPNHRKTMVHYK